MNNFKFKIVILMALLFSGCATIPSQLSSSGFYINGFNYFSLAALCSSRGVNFEYDAFTRRVVISNDLHKVKLQVGEKLIVLDGNPQYLKHPVDIYQGAVVVPGKFKEQIFDHFFKESPLSGKTSFCNLKIRKVVIDAGHGGNDPGAVGKSGLREKDVNLDIAKRLGQIFKNDGVDVIFTRSTDAFIPLSTRVNIANKNAVDLFISIHSNANRVKSLNGFEVYYVSPTVSDTQRALSAAKDGNLKVDSSCISEASLNTKAILWDMIYNYNRAEAIELSRNICRSIDQKLNVEILGVKSARFYVLKGVQMPAVLIEVGFVSNGNEEKFLKNYYYRQQLAEGIAEGVFNYAKDMTLVESRK